MRTVPDVLTDLGEKIANVFPGKWPGLLQAKPPTEEELQKRFYDMENAAPWCLLEKAKKEEPPMTVGLSPEAIATLLLIFLNKKEGDSGGMTIQWGFKGYEFRNLGELTQKGLISNPVGGRDSKSLWLTPAGAALGSIIRDILLPELKKLAGSLHPKEV